MAGAPNIKVYDADGNYRAAVKEYEAAACLMALYGDGSTIRMGHAKKQTLWTEGPEGNGCAAESWDAVAAHCYSVWTDMCINGWRAAGIDEDTIAKWIAGDCAISDGQNY